MVLQNMGSWTSPPFLPVDVGTNVSRVSCVVSWRRREFFECGIPVLQFGSECVSSQCFRGGKSFEVGCEGIVSDTNVF